MKLPMIIWDFNVIVALGVSLCLAVVIALWVFYTLKRERREAVSSRQFLRQCGFCGHLYFDYAKKALYVCPCCGSYQD